MARSKDIQRDEPQEPRQSIADVLATAREEYGQDLRSVSDALRIRYVYLQAIEDGRFQDLPGMTYAVGFVRSYSDYLGLDTEEVVQKFKEEVGGADKRQQLVFPVPKPEGKIPGGALILISILLAALAYGGWYVLSQDDQSLMEMLGGETQVEQPDSQSEGAPEPATTPEDGSNAETSGSSVVEDTVETIASTAEDAAESVSEGAGDLSDELLSSGDGSESLPAAAPNQAAETVESAADTAEGAAPTAGDSLEPPEDTTPNIEIPETTGESSQETAPSDQPIAEELLEEGQSEGQSQGQGGEQSAALPEAPAIAPAEESASGEVFGAPPEEPVRVVIEATHDSWVQIFDQDNELLLARVLRSGDRYRVPQSEGMSMLTGNAGGLEVRVDGALAPSLGPFGEVVRNIALEPVKLLNGQAVGAGANPQQ